MASRPAIAKTTRAQKVGLEKHEFRSFRILGPENSFPFLGRGGSAPDGAGAGVPPCFWVVISLGAVFPFTEDFVNTVGAHSMRSISVTVTTAPSEVIASVIVRNKNEMRKILKMLQVWCSKRIVQVRGGGADLA
jgi:hypothetical protein